MVLIHFYLKDDMFEFVLFKKIQNKSLFSEKLYWYDDTIFKC